jgi:hypothetical protein
MSYSGFKRVRRQWVRTVSRPTGAPTYTGRAIENRA